MKQDDIEKLPPRNKKPNLDKKPSQKKQDEGQDRANSVFIAKQLIIGSQDLYQKRLLDFKNIKNQNYDKFTQRIEQNLSNNRIPFEQSREIFARISKVASEQNTTPHQMNAIMLGFFNFWSTFNLNQQQIKSLFNFINNVYYPINKKYIIQVTNLINHNFKEIPEEILYFQQQALRLSNKYFRTKDQQKILPLIYGLDLCQAFSYDKIVQLAIRSHNVNDIVYIFKDKQDNINRNLVDLFIDRCVNKQSNDQLKKCQTIIKILKLNPFQFGNMIDKMLDKYINYQIRTNSLYFIELVIRHDLNLIKALVKQIKKNRERQAKYFIFKYGLDVNEFYYYDKTTEKERLSILKIQNILQSDDYFGPTQIEVLSQSNENDKPYLYLKDLNINQEDIHFIDQSNIKTIDIKQTFQSRSIGIDSEATGGTHVFDQSMLTILQVYNGQSVLVFDYLHLKDNQKFKQIISYLFQHCKIYGHDHPKEITAIQKQLNLYVPQKIMQQLQRERSLDTNKYFKVVYPKQTKSNLAYICEFLMKKKISKYEQCSGWRNRPLRRAQLHYAALDCVLPKILGEQLQATKLTAKNK